MNVLVTGGAGFIGSHLVAALVARGDAVVVLDDLSSGDSRRLAGVAEAIRFSEGSILDPRALDAAMVDIEVVFHEAAIASVMRSVDDPVAVDEVNVRGTIEVMRAAGRNGVRRVVFAGSSAVYGVPRSLPSREIDGLAPESPYGVSKLAAESYVRVLGALLGVETVTLRYFNVFGADQDPASEYAAVIPKFVMAAIQGVRPTVNGAGTASRDFVHIDDVVQANLLAAQADRPSGIVCNIATGHERSLLELLDAISVSLGRQVEPSFGPPRPGDIERSVADISMAASTLAYQPAVSFEAGIAATVEWYARQLASGTGG